MDWNPVTGFFPLEAFPFILLAAAVLWVVALLLKLWAHYSD